MRHNVRCAGLARELKVFAGQHVPIQSKSEFHSGSTTATRVWFRLCAVPSHILTLTAPAASSRKRRVGELSMQFILFRDHACPTLCSACYRRTGTPLRRFVPRHPAADSAMGEFAAKQI